MVTISRNVFVAVELRTYKSICPNRSYNGIAVKVGATYFLSSEVLPEDRFKGNLLNVNNLVGINNKVTSFGP